MPKIELKTQCYDCVHRRMIPGDYHSQCVMPDPNMTGDAYGIASGWFFYPFNFDPIWRTSECANYKRKT